VSDARDLMAALAAAHTEVERYERLLALADGVPVDARGELLAQMRLARERLALAQQRIQDRALERHEALLRCDDCGCISSEARGWQGILVEHDEDGSHVVVALCPPCGARAAERTDAVAGYT
jgi:hypothetical protein